MPENAFVGRERELAFLEEAFTREGSAFVPVYGRRRIGKTTLILKFLREKLAVFYLGQQVPPALQLRAFLRAVAETLKLDWLRSVEISDWQAAFRLVGEHWPKDEPMVLVLDEFQWIVEGSPEIPSVIQGLWDHEWAPRGNVFLILCGSYIGFMEREVLGRKSPLFGRRTGQIKLNPFHFREAAQFHPHWSRQDQAKAWFLCGGVPYYLNQLSERVSIATNIRRQFLDPSSPLFREPHFLLREELRDLENYQGILLGLAEGSGSVSDLATLTQLPGRSLPYYLDQLIQLGYVAKVQPLTRRGRLRRVRYQIADPLLRFWFRFVSRHESGLTLMGADALADQHIIPQLESYFGHCFEHLCQEALPFLYAEEGTHTPYEIGSYYDKHTQIDVVGIREDGWIDLGECKWCHIPSAPTLWRELARKRQGYPNPDNETIQMRLFLRHSLSKRVAVPSEIMVHDLESLYGDPA